MSQLLAYTVVFLSLLLTNCGIYQPREVNGGSFEPGKDGSGPRLTIIGDSQTTGVIASTTLGQQPSGELMSNLLPFFYSNNPTIATMQEHFSEYGNAAVATDESWGLRAEIAKHYNLAASDVPLYLAAQWGGKVRDLPELIAKLQRSYQDQGQEPDVILLMIGANDLCNGEPAQQFASNFAQGLLLIAENLPQVLLLVAAIPPIPQLLRYDHNYNETLTCQQVRQRFCPAIFAKDFNEHYIAYNASIERLVKSLKNEYNSSVLFVDGFRGMYFEENMLAFDCFHPNLRAQKLYAGYFAAAYERYLSTGSN